MSVEPLTWDSLQQRSYRPLIWCLEQCNSSIQNTINGMHQQSGIVCLFKAI